MDFAGLYLSSAQSTPTPHTDSKSRAKDGRKRRLGQGFQEQASRSFLSHQI